MTEWKLKRFWTEASVSETEGGYAVLLDGRGVKTPAKTSLVVPTVELARAIADEWDAQEGTIDPTSMPFTRSANAAIDKVTHQFDEVGDFIIQLSASVPPLVNVISLGAAPKQLAIYSLDSSSMFLAFRDNA